jgi:hypothetical protein
MFSNKVSRRDFVKLMGAGSLFVGLGALGIPDIIKNIREVSAMDNLYFLSIMFT